MEIRQINSELTLVYKAKNDFIVEILVRDNFYEAWIYKKTMCVKKLMFGIPKKNSCVSEMENLIEKNLEKYMIDYEMSYCYE